MNLFFLNQEKYTWAGTTEHTVPVGKQFVDTTVLKILFHG